MTGDSDPGERIARLRGQLATLEDLVGAANESRLESAPADGGWSPREVVAHLARHHDLLVLRLRRILSEPEPELARYRAQDDPDWPRLAAAPVRAQLDRLRALRADVVELLHLLGPEQRARRGVHPRLGALDLDGWLEFFLLHEAHHLYRLRLQLGAPGT